MYNTLNSKGINIVFWYIRSMLNKIDDIREKSRDGNINIKYIRFEPCF